MFRAPAGCLQYYYGDTTYNIQSFNWDGTKTCSTGCLIEEQSYTICYRPEKGIQIQKSILYLDQYIIILKYSFLH